MQKLQKHLGVKFEPGKYEQNLWNITEKYTPLLSKIPGISCICVCNSLAMNAAHKDSDIDLFIITRKNRLWTARIFATLLLTLLGKRKTAKKHAGQFCLSFFILEEALSLETITLENDIYLSYWFQTLVPVINRDAIFEKFIEKNQPLLKHLPQLPHSGILSPLGEKGATDYFACSSSPLLQRRGLGGGSCMRDKKSEQKMGKTHKLLTSCGDYCEKLLKTIFLPRTKKSFQKLGKPFGVVISDTMLKFHDKDRRKEINEKIIN